MSDQLVCPQCGCKIVITEALANQLKQELESSLKREIESKEKELEQRLLKAQSQEKELLVKQQELEVEVEKKTQEQVSLVKKDLWEKAQIAALEKNNIQIKDLEEQLLEAKQHKEEAQKRELEVMKQKRELEQAKRDYQLQMERKLDEQRRTISEKIEKELQEEMRLKLLEKEKQLEDTKKALLEAQRKAAQGSQQTQGEVLELDLEHSLNDIFVRDLIEPVGKGVSGADIVHKIRTPSGQVCGVILWEVKQTKHWTEGWITKFKDDLRAQKANIPVLVTISLPKDIEGFGLYEGVWVTQPKFAIQLAIALRKNLLDVAYERATNAGKGEKAELLFGYISSHEFKQRVEALVEVFAEMQSQVTKERIAYEKSWKQREAQLNRLFINTAGMYGEIQGLVGPALPEIKGLELDSGESSKNIPEEVVSPATEEQLLF